MKLFPPERLGLVLGPPIVLLLAGRATAQIHTGEIFGRVTDESWAVVPGASVTLEGPALIQSRSVLTTASGAYRFPSLPTGSYTLRFEMAGFSRLIRESVQVETGFNAEINVRLRVGRAETVSVSGESPVVNTTSTSIMSNFSKELLEAIPSARDPWVILEQTPGMVMDRQNVGGNWSGQQSETFVVHGSDANQMWNLDGATITDMARNASPGYYDFDSFEEIQITTGGNDASQDSGGVSINFVTKSGGNAFHGSGRVYVADKALESDNVSPELEAQHAGSGNPIKNIKEYGFEVGGPIKTNKLWFWGGYSQSDINVGVINFFKPGKPEVNRLDNLETDRTVLKNFNTKLSFQWSKRHRSSFLYSYGDKVRNARGASPKRLLEATNRQSGPVYMALFDHQWIPTDRLILNVKATHVDGGFLLDFHSDDLADVQPTLENTTKQEGRSGTRREYIRPTTELRLDGTYFLSDFLGGDHATKFGARYRSTPYQEIAMTGGGAVARFKKGEPDRGLIFRDGHISNGLWEYSAYANDSYRRGRWTVNFGLRLDYQDDEAQAVNVPANPILPDLLPALSFEGADSRARFIDLSPRLGVVFDLRGNGKTVLKTSAARYYGLGIYTADEISPTGQVELRYPWNDANGDRFVQRNELTLTDRQYASSNYDPAKPSEAHSPKSVDPGLENNITDELTFGIEHELAANFGLSLTYIYRHYFNYKDDFRVGLHSAQFVPASKIVPCGNASCDETGYTVTFWQLPFELPTETIVRNHQRAQRYHGLEFVARKRFSDRWLMNAAFTWNNAIRHYEGGPDVDYQDPTNVAQQDGRPAGKFFATESPAPSARWLAKASAMYQLPAGFSAAVFVNLRDGFPFNRRVSVDRQGLEDVDVLVRPIGSERYETFRQVDVRLDKTLSLGKTRLIASLDAFNVFNEGIVLARNEIQNAETANDVEQILAPRVVRLGLRFQF